MKPRNAVSIHIWESNKIKLSSYNSICPNSGRTMDLHPNTTIINEAGVFQLIFSSKLDKALEFQDYVFLLFYQAFVKLEPFNQKMRHNQYLMLNERNLHEKVVDYIRKYYPDVLFNSTLGEMQDTSDKRLMSYKMGYTAGFSDLLIYEHSTYYNGLCLEFKSPSGFGFLSENKNI